MTMTQADLMHVLRGTPGATARCAASEIEYLTITLAEALEAVQGEREVDIECLINRAIDPVRVAGGAEWRCEPPEALAAATLAAETEAPVAPPQAPRVGEVWEAPDYIARTVGRGHEDRVWFRLQDDNRLFSVRLDRWHAWVRRSGARVVA